MPKSLSPDMFGSQYQLPSYQEFSYLPGYNLYLSRAAGATMSSVDSFTILRVRGL